MLNRKLGDESGDRERSRHAAYRNSRRHWVRFTPRPNRRLLGHQLQAAPQGTTSQIPLPDERVSITPSSGESMRLTVKAVGVGRTDSVLLRDIGSQEGRNLQ